MPVSIFPYIPQYITVHLGPASQWAENVTVTFPDYIKNVASSEVYPTWNEQALRANILAQISFALNRVYTEYYPSRGYDFDITGSTINDQKFTKGPNTGARALWTLCPPGSAMVPPSPARAYPSGAVKSWLSRGWGIWIFYGIITEMISS